MPQGVHLVGSIPLKSCADVFSRLPQALPGRLRRIPDGETGKRHYFVRWQKDYFPEEILMPHLRASKSPGPADFDIRPEHILPPTYNEWAISSYRTFCDLRAQALIPPGVRFQVSLPTPLNVISSRVDPRYQAKIEPWYERKLIDALKDIQLNIPAYDLAIQWDAAIDVAFLEYERGRFQAIKPYFSPIGEGVLERMTRLAYEVGPAVEMGYHLCYGDSEHEHFIQPNDLGLLVDFANRITERVSSFRPVQWFHMPVPKDRTDVGYFEPLKDISIANAELFLGLVHPNDEKGTHARIKSATVIYDKAFGVATECGMGRTPVEELGSILAISAQVSDKYGHNAPIEVEKAQAAL